MHCTLMVNLTVITNWDHLRIKVLFHLSIVQNKSPFNVCLRVCAFSLVIEMDKKCKPVSIFALIAGICGKIERFLRGMQRIVALSINIMAKNQVDVITSVHAHSTLPVIASGAARTKACTQCTQPILSKQKIISFYYEVNEWAILTLFTRCMQCAVDNSQNEINFHRSKIAPQNGETIELQLYLKQNNILWSF